MVAVQIQQIRVPAGQRILLRDISWSDFERILTELGENRAARIAYRQETLEIMTPLPEHESAKENIGDLIKALLEELEIEFLALGSTTFKDQRLGEGVEPGQCFYIAHESVVRGKDRLDLAVDPPPDSVLEIEVTSRTHPEIYRSLQVLELWRFERGQLQINLLQSGSYVQADASSLFPNLDVKTAIPQYAQRMKTVGRNQTLKAFRQWVRDRLRDNQQDEQPG
ncbi:MAG: Uma2 family endonuclease [Cyanobacteria bacterium P01_H01_bin.121]